MGCGPESEQRGISHLIGAILLIGITMTAVVLIVVAGTGTIGDVNEDNKAEVAGQTFAQTDEAFQAFARQDRNRSRTVELPESMNGDVEVRDSSWRLRLNGNEKCSSGTRNLGAMHYTGEDQSVGYEGGGIWKIDESGARMDSPPKMTYEDGSLSIRFPNITGDVTTSNRISLSSNVSKSEMRNRDLSMALYTDYNYGASGTVDDEDIECAPSDLHKGTLWINDSQYAGAWANYFNNNYEEPRVEVLTSGPVESGDPVKVEFKLGDVSDPKYEVTHMNVTRAPSGDVEVEANVTNTGGLEGEQETKIYLNDSTDSTTHDDKSFGPEKLKSGERSKYQFYTTPPTAGTYTVKVATEDDQETKMVEFDSVSGTPSPSITVDAPQNTSVGSDATAEVDVSNSGGMTAVRTVYFRVNGNLNGTEEVDVHPGDTTTLTFDLPTETAGRYDITVETQEISSESGTDTYYVGNQPYFEISTVDSPDAVPATSSYDIEADIENRGHMQGVMPVEITLQNASTGNNVTEKEETLTIDGRAYTGPNSDTLELSHTFYPSDQGRYRYIVETPNETSIGTFSVGDPTNPNFVIENLEFSEERAWFGDDIYFNVTVENNGGATGAQEVAVTSGTGATIWTEQIVLARGEKTTIQKERPVSPGKFEQGFNRISASTNNATEDETLYVEDGERIEDGNGSIEINRRVKAEITVLGAELEGRGYRNCWQNYYGGWECEDPYISQTATNMWLDITNGSTGNQEEIDLFTDRYGGDVNHPGAEKAMIQEDYPNYDPTYTRNNPYKYTVNLSAGSELSLFAESLDCDTWDYTDVVWGDIEYSEGATTDADSKACTETDGSNIKVSKDDNSQNVVILGDGDEVPSFGAAHSYQRGLHDMLGSRINDDGTLSLAPGERVFLYELSKEDADPDNAAGSGDPDYNDAVALFKVAEVQRDVQEPANITIEDASDIPAQVPEGEREQFSVEVKNHGGQAGSTNVLFDLDGTVPQEESVNEIKPGETRTVRFTVPEDMEPGDYDYELNVGSNPNEERHGSITIGSPTGVNFQISQLEGPSVVERDESPTASVTVTNTGTVEDTQTIELEKEGGSATKTRTLGPKDDVELEFDLPTPPSDGYYSYRVSTDDDTSVEYRYWVGESDVNINHVEAGTKSYREGELVERRSLNSLTVNLENSGSVGDSRDVTLNIENDSGWSYGNTKTVQFGEGRVGSYPAWPSFGFTSLSEGYYDYQVTVEDEGATTRTWSGEIFIQDDADVGNSTNSSSPVGVDSNEVVISG